MGDESQRGSQRGCESQGGESQQEPSIWSFYFDNGSAFLDEDVLKEFIKWENRKDKIEIY